ncbi:MAG: hypothetical protein HY332_11215 [Chloroflexi bacterium]|nr:hypothetical protein [Chloroflexota bacterium]
MTQLLETGIKVVDLLAPVPRGGTLRLFGPWGVGKLVLVGEMIHSITTCRSGAAVVVAVGEHGGRADALLRELRQMGVHDRTTAILGQPSARSAERATTIEDGLGAAERLRDEGRDVLLVLDWHLVALSSDQELLARRRTSMATEHSTDGSVTLTLTAFSPDDDDTDLVTISEADSRLAFDRSLFKQAMYPAISPLLSSSRLLKPTAVGEEHARVAEQVRDTLRRARELRGIVDTLGLNQMPAEDRQAVARAARLQRLLSQPFSVAEPFTGVPGEYVPVAETVAGFKAILAGRYDDVPETAFYLVGTVEQARKKGETPDDRRLTTTPWQAQDERDE